MVVEILELLVAIAPTMATLVLVRRAATTIAGWFVQVLGSALLAVISLGLLLTRLTATCAADLESCAPATKALVRAPGIFSHCHICIPDQSSGELLSKLNYYVFPIHAAAAALCVCASFVAVLRFVLWAKKTLRGVS
jgi:hypothetical protein